MSKPINIPAEDLFDFFSKNSDGYNVARFRDDYRNYRLQLEDTNSMIDDYMNEDQEEIILMITKKGFMQLLLNRNFSCDDYSIVVHA